MWLLFQPFVVVVVAVVIGVVVRDVVFFLFFLIIFEARLLSRERQRREREREREEGGRSFSRYPPRGCCRFVKSELNLRGDSSRCSARLIPFSLLASNP